MQNKISKIINNSLEREFVVRLNRRQLDKINTIAQAALAVVGAAGLITLAAAAPNIFTALNQANHLRKKFKGLAFDEKQKKLQYSFYYLRKSGLVKFKGDKSGFQLLLSKKGQKLLTKLDFQTLKVKNPKVWDRKWWVVAADIPTKQHRLGADQLRQKLKEMGFYFLQRTLWFYPYDPRTEIQFIATTYGVEKFITIMEISRLDMEDEQKLLRFFNL
jgi:DNA-binding transcriptional regulator PaaX